MYVSRTGVVPDQSVRQAGSGASPSVDAISLNLSSCHIPKALIGHSFCAWTRYKSICVIVVVIVDGHCSEVTETRI